MSQSSVYRELDSLISIDLVSKVMSHRDGRGRPITGYAIFGYQSEDIVSLLRGRVEIGLPLTPLCHVLSSLYWMIIY